MSAETRPRDPQGPSPSQGWRVHVDSETSTYDLVRLSHLRRTLDAGLGYSRRLTFGVFATPEQLIPDGFACVREHRGRGYLAVHAVAPGVSLWMDTEAGGTVVDLAAVDVDLRQTLSERLRRRGRELTRRCPVEPEVHVWQGSGRDVTVTRRAITVPRWDDVRGNYPPRVRTLVEPLVAMAGAPAAAGRLLLWHGPPGTGKTRAVMTLIGAWSPWCDAHVVADPERLFTDPHYLLEILAAPPVDTVQDEPADDGQPAAMAGRWRLVVCEDADGFLSANARDRCGPALGRLLNVTDGILGQGARALVLLTTNEDAGRLHPALTRPGRCLAVTEFTPFPADEASSWLGEHGPATGPMTLAELYAAREDRHPLGVPGAQPELLGAYL